MALSSGLHPLVRQGGERNLDQRIALTFKGYSQSHASDAYRLWFEFSSAKSHVLGAAILPRKTKEKTMSTQISFETPTQDDVDRYIAQAHQLRSEYTTRWLKSGLAKLRNVFVFRGRAQKIA